MTTASSRRVGSAHRWCVKGVLFLIGLFLAVSNSIAMAHTDVTAEQARDLIDSTPEIIVVDVREPYEYCDATGHIPGALNYPWSSGVLRDRYGELPTDRPILVVCRSGGRSNAAATFLDSNGFSMVYDMLRGMNAWLWETAPCKYSGGSGTPDDPYQIATAADLIALGETPENYDKHFILTADIDLDPNLPGRKVFDRAVIAPDTNDLEEGFQGTAFTGVLDGNGYTISRVTINGASFLGLFGYTWGATVFDLGLVGVDVNGIGNKIGGLVGTNLGGKITLSHCQGTVIGGGEAGGLAGANYGDGTISRCYSICAVQAGVSGGGLVGANVGVDSGIDTMTGCQGSIAAISDCYGIVLKSSRVSGLLVGSNSRPSEEYEFYPSLIKNCYAVCDYPGMKEASGLVGVNYDWNGQVLNSFWDAQTCGSDDGGGGGTLKTTTEMQDIQTYLEGSWDFVDELENGACEIWRMPETGGYPVLAPLRRLQGAGTQEDAYLVSDAVDLAVVQYDPYAYYSLTTSIDLSGIPWSSAVIPVFSGVFEGNGHTLSNLTITGDGYLGLFGVLWSGAEVRNLGVADVNMTSCGDDSDDAVGGLGGYSRDGSSIANCYSTGKVSGHDAVGGLIGRNVGIVNTSRSAATVHGSDWPSGVGGLVGQNDGSIAACYSTGAVTGEVEVAFRSGTGGLVGYNRGSITSSHNNGAVSGKWYVGGLVGVNVGSVATSYSNGKVTGDGNVGGLVGENHEQYVHPIVYGTTVASFWDIQTSGQTASVGGTGKMMVEMQTAGTFLEAGWDFVGETANGTEDIWWILEGRDYPRLWWEAEGN